MNTNLETALARLRMTFGANVARPVVHGGVVALPTGLAPTPENLAALEAAWRFDPRAEQPANH